MEKVYLRSKKYVLANFQKAFNETNEFMVKALLSAKIIEALRDNNLKAKLEKLYFDNYYLHMILKVEREEFEKTIDVIRKTIEKIISSNKKERKMKKGI